MAGHARKNPPSAAAHVLCEAHVYAKASDRCETSLRSSSTVGCCICHEKQVCFLDSSSRFPKTTSGVRVRGARREPPRAGGAGAWHSRFTHHDHTHIEREMGKGVVMERKKRKAMENARLPADF